MSHLMDTWIEGEPYRIPVRYVLETVIGKGSYGHVCSCMDLITNISYAIKKNKDVFRENSLIPMRVLRELKILMHLRHPNIIALRDVIIPDNYEDFNNVYMVMDLMPLDLKDAIGHTNLTEPHIQYIMYQLLLALQYIHSADIIHRDLKPENILIDSNCEIKLCDFGLARGYDVDDEISMSTNYVQTRWYRAPELIMNGSNITNKIDIWSAGCIMAELLTGKVLFRGNSPFDQIHRIIKLLGTPKSLDRYGSPDSVSFFKKMHSYSAIPLHEKFSTTSNVALDLLGKMLVMDPSERISAEDALKHPYFAEIMSEEDFKYATRFDYSYENVCQSLESIKKECYRTIMEANGIISQYEDNSLEIIDITM
jgi:serine/threonine protein kinase